MQILFVCTGNTCRSLMAEAYSGKMIQACGLKGAEARSCGTYASPDFRVPKAVKKILSEENIDVSGHISTPINRELVGKAEVILAMEKIQVADILSLYPEARNKTHLFKDFSGHLPAGTDIKDPIGQSEMIYRACAKEIKDGLKNIFQKLFPECSISGG